MSGRSSAGTVLALGALLLLQPPAGAERLKELATIQGARSNQLVGYGLVVGLAQTGDDYNVPFTQQSILALLRRMGTLSPDANLLRTRDTAAVLVTALVPPFARGGMQVDVNVAALGNSRSLQGGVLISTPLRNSDGRIYALAQGPLLIGGAMAAGLSGSLALRNHVTTGRIPEGAILERDLPSSLKSDSLTFLLRHPDFTTANRIAGVIARSLAAESKGDPALGAASVRAIDGGTVQVQVTPLGPEQLVAIAARLEDLEVEPDAPARIVVNERSGVVVIGSHVRLGQAAVSHGHLTVKINEGVAVAQPNAFAAGQSVAVAQSQVHQQEAPSMLQAVGPAANVEDVVQTLNRLGMSTRELIAVLQALKAAGALRGELVLE